MIYRCHPFGHENEETFLLSMLDRHEACEEPWDVAEEKTNRSETLVSNSCWIAHTGGNRLSTGDVAGVMIKVFRSVNRIYW